MCRLGLAAVLALLLPAMAGAAGMSFGTSLPGTCVVADRFALTVAPYSSYYCSYANTWFLMGMSLADDTIDPTKYFRGDGQWAVPSGGGTFSGIGACASNQWASTLNNNAAPTCTQPAFSNLSGSAADSQIPDTITVNLAATATALAADPADCSGNNFALGIVALGTATCAQPAFTNLSGSATDAQVPDTITLSNLTQVTTRAISDTTGTLAVSRGGTNLTASADDNVMIGNATTWETKALPSCSAGQSVLQYNTSTNAFSCGGSTTLTSTTTQSDATIATYTAITGLSFTPAASTNYTIECWIVYTSTAATTGINFAWDTPATPTMIMMQGNTTTTALGATEGFSQNADNVGTSTANAVITTQNLASLRTLFKNGTTSATMSLGFTPETANSVSVILGSVCQYRVF